MLWRDTWQTQAPPLECSRTRHVGRSHDLRGGVRRTCCPSCWHCGRSSHSLFDATDPRPCFTAQADQHFRSIVCPPRLLQRREGLEGVHRTPGMAAPGQSTMQLERKAAAKEEIVNATSGAREIVDHAAFNARAVGKILLHPFNKDAKTEAIATARADKAESGQKMAAIREVGAQQADALRGSARVVATSEAVQPGAFGATGAKPTPEGAAAPPDENREYL